MLNTNSSIEWLQAGSKFLLVFYDDVWCWLETSDGREWLRSVSMWYWLSTSGGGKWLKSNDGKFWCKEDKYWRHELKENRHCIIV